MPVRLCKAREARNKNSAGKTGLTSYAEGGAGITEKGNYSTRGKVKKMTLKLRDGQSENNFT